jgi:phosphoserine aminotransferase
METTTHRKHIFNAGPAVLSEEVIRATAEGVLELDGKGISVLEISHRSKEFIAIMDEASALLRELMGIPDNYSVLYLTGGASTQFMMIPYNLLPEGGTAAYTETGTWAKKAIKEAQFFGNVNVLGSSADSNFSYIPKGYEVPADAAYFHVTSNNTIVGTQMQEYPDSPVPLVVDMSSDILSREVDVSSMGMIYAGAQKNLGPSGVTLVIINNDLVGQSKREMPTMLNYQTHIDKGSMFNTPPVLPVYTIMHALRWLKAGGGVSAMQQRNEEKAALLYNEIDANPLFKGTAAPEDRSLMNVTFVPADGQEGWDEEFVSGAAEHGIMGIKGHRSVGGFRASIYNALPRESVQVLVDYMRDFAEKRG